jgi:hypothetical protein
MAGTFDRCSFYVYQTIIGKQYISSYTIKDPLSNFFRFNDSDKSVEYNSTRDQLGTKTGEHPKAS